MNHTHHIHVVGGRAAVITIIKSQSPFGLSNTITSGSSKWKISR